MKKGKLSQIEKQTIEKLYKQSKTVDEISKFLDRSRDAVLKIILTLDEEQSEPEPEEKPKKDPFSRKSYAKPNTWVDDLSQEREDLQGEKERSLFKRRGSRPAPKAVEATCRHCGKTEKTRLPTFEGFFTCYKCSGSK